MKRILITLTLLFISHFGFTQLNLKDTGFYNTLDDAVTAIKNNQNINSENINVLIFNAITFKIYKLEYTYKYFVFTDKDDVFLDIVIISKSINTGNGEDTRWSINDIGFNYEKDIKLVGIEIKPMNHKIILTNNSYILIELNDQKHLRYETKTVYGEINISQYKDNKMIDWYLVTK